MNRKLNIINEQVRNLAMKIIQDLPFDHIHSVHIAECKANRSLDQNALYWKWLAIMSHDLGHTKDELHVIMKKKFCIPIMLSHPDDYPEISAAWATLTSTVTEEDVIQALAPIISTVRLKVPHMSEYLHDIYREAQEFSIFLPDPRDLGRKYF